MEQALDIKFGTKIACDITNKMTQNNFQKWQPFYNNIIKKLKITLRKWGKKQKT